jgi:hypothetical protein
MAAYGEELEKANKARDCLLPELEKRILGKTLPGWQCNCGAHKHGASRAIRVVPAGEQYPYQVTWWLLWVVDMQHVDYVEREGRLQLDYHYAVEMSRFIDSAELDKMFGEAFVDVDDKVLIAG